MDLHICPQYLLLWNDWVLIEGIMGFLNTHFSHSCFLVSGRQILVTLTSLCQAGSHPTCSLHLTIIWSWDAIRNILCSILCSSYLFSLHPPFWSLKSDQRMTQVHALLTSSAPDGSPVHASPLAASTVQLGCRLIFVSHYSPMISAKALTADFGLLSRQLRATLQKSEEILREIQKSELLSTVFDSLKTWAGQVKGEGSDRWNGASEWTPNTQKIPWNTWGCLSSAWSPKGHAVLARNNAIKWILASWKSY